MIWGFFPLQGMGVGGENGDKYAQSSLQLFSVLSFVTWLTRQGFYKLSLSCSELDVYADINGDHPERPVTNNSRCSHEEIPTRGTISALLLSLQ